MKDYARSFYKSKAWQRCRDAYYKHQFGMCERCPEPGRIVHHKIYITPTNINDSNITLSFDNLELLCIDCHNKEHFERDEQGLRQGLCFDSQGRLIKIN